MELRGLRYFLAVAREENITKAAETLYLTQPTLSRQLKELEEELGVTLFERGQRKIRLTSEGLLFKRRAEEILELVKKSESELQRSDSLEGTISIGMGDLSAEGILYSAISKFQEKYDKVIFDFYIATADDIKDKIDQGLLDLGIMLEPVNKDKYEFIRLGFVEHFVVAVKNGDPLSFKSEIRREDLIGEKLILPRRTVVQNEIASYFGDSYKKLNVKMLSNLPSACPEAIEKADMKALIIEGSAKYWDREKIKLIPLSPPLTTSSIVSWKKDVALSKASTRFISFLKDEIEGNDLQK